MSVRKALSLSFTRSGIALAFNLATVVIVSRLLTPAEVGVFSVATALVTLVHMLRDFGVSELIIQEKELTDAIVGSAFTVNLGIGWLLAIVLFGTSGWIGAFYGDPGVAQVTRVLSLSFILMPFGTTQMARMRRDFHFSLLLRINIAEIAVRSGSTIALAYLGFSYMSMAWGSVAAMVTVIAAVTIWGAEYRVRGLGLAEWRRVASFGSNRTLADIVTQVGEQSANIVVGRMIGMGAAGLYSRGNGIVRLFRLRVIRAIGTVAFPAYARDDRETNTAPLLFRTSLVYLTGISWPFFAFSALMAYPIIHIMFGSQWDAAVPLMRWLCGAAILATLVYQCGSMMTAIGRYREVTWIQIEYQVFRIVLTVLAAFYSLEAVAASQVVVYVLAVALYYRKLVRYDALKLPRLVQALAPSAALTIAVSLVPAAVLIWWPGPPAAHYIASFVVAAGGAGLAWLAAVFAFKHPLSAEIRNAWATFRARAGFLPGSG